VRAVAIAHRPGMLGQVVSAIGRAGGVIGAVDFVEVSEGKLPRDATVDAAGPRQWVAITAALDVINGVHVVDTIDRTFLLHVGARSSSATSTC
jgi:malate dehydrogenase (oxaloacetate-decarboxylating)